jgi:8-oxo-dGTP diphosphatase
MPDLPYCYEYPRPALTADAIVVTREAAARVLLIRRKHPPFAATWALPGGFVDENEPLETAARRELHEETGIQVGRLEQLQTFGDPGRDPRGWTVSVAFIARVNPESVQPKAADDASEVAWHLLDQLPPLAFDHASVLEFARKWLQDHPGRPPE